MRQMSTIGNSSNIVWHKCSVKKIDRQELLQQKGCVIWITGLSGSGLCSIACSYLNCSLLGPKCCLGYATFDDASTFCCCTFVLKITTDCHYLKNPIEGILSKKIWFIGIFLNWF